MSLLPQTNVQLVDISSPGHAADYDRPPGNPVSKWSGSVGAYLEESIVTGLASGPGELNRTRKSTLTIPDNLNPSVNIESGDLVTYMVPDGVTRVFSSVTRTVQTFSAPPSPLPGVPAPINLALIDAPA